MRARASVVCMAVVALATGMLAGCGDDDTKPVSLTVKASEPSEGTYAFDLPSTIDGGVVAITLDNVGKEPHELGLVLVKEGTDLDSFVEDVLESEGGPIPEYVLAGAGVGFAAPGGKATSTQKLAAGTYLFFCTFGEDDQVHYKNGMLGSLTVEGSKGKGDLPKSDGSIKAKEYGFDVSGLKAGSHIYSFENTGKELHHAQLMPINDGSTFDDVKTFFETEGEPTGPPPVDFEGGTGTVVLASGAIQTTTLDLKAGDYVMVCFINDRAGGPPHFTMGMLQQVTVS